MDATDVSSTALDSRVRRAAQRFGLVTRKSRWRLGSIDNHGGFMLIEPTANRTVGGARFNLTATDVMEWCQTAAE